MHLNRQTLPVMLPYDEIARRIPHQGGMCLLDCVTAWDDHQIHCEASTHHAANNPLRAYGRLGAACGIEYGAQAMAVHGALIAEHLPHAGADRGPPKAGYLASIRSVTLHVDALDQLPGSLLIHAERQSGDESTILYSFSLHAGPALLLSGRAVVILDADGLGLTSARENS